MAARYQIISFVTLTLAVVLPCSLPAQADTLDATQQESKPAAADPSAPVISAVPPQFPSSIHTRAQEFDYRRAHNVVHTFYLKNASAPNDGNEILTGLRLMLDPSIKLYLIPSQNAVAAEILPNEVPLLEGYIAAWDRPKRLYRLTYTLTESDSGKRIGVQNFSIDLLNGQRTTLKNGSKIPVATGSYSNGESTGATGVQTQFTYLDVGINVDATVTGTSTGVVLKSKFEQSSLAEAATISGVNEPVIRQTVVESVTALTPGKAVNLGGTDVTGSTRHFDIDVTLQP